MKKVLIFDFDGVIVNSVRVKGDAFAQLFESYESGISNKVKAYHYQNGGMPRAEKIKNIFKKVLNQNPVNGIVVEYCREFSKIVTDMVIKSDFIPGSFEFIRNNKNIFKQYIVSATPQEELQYIVEKLKINEYFINIYGSPMDKVTHITTIISNNGNKSDDAVLIGDSLSDFESSNKAGVDFIGVKNDLVSFPDGVIKIDNLFELREKLNQI